MEKYLSIPFASLSNQEIFLLAISVASKMAFSDFRSVSVLENLMSWKRFESRDLSIDASNIRDMVELKIVWNLIDGLINQSVGGESCFNSSGNFLFIFYSCLEWNLSIFIFNSNFHEIMGNQIKIYITPVMFWMVILIQKFFLCYQIGNKNVIN